MLLLLVVVSAAGCQVNGSRHSSAAHINCQDLPITSHGIQQLAITAECAAHCWGLGLVMDFDPLYPVRGSLHSLLLRPLLLMLLLLLLLLLPHCCCRAPAAVCHLLAAV